MKIVASLVAIVCCSVSSLAAPYYFQSASGQNAWLEIDAWAGSGANESILVVDWNVYGGPYQAPSHAFGFRWDGTATQADMFQAFHDAGIFTLTTGYGGAFLYNISYDTGSETLSHTDEPGSWNLASADSPYAQWGVWGTGNGLGDWYDNKAGIDQQTIQNGWIDGVNAIAWFSGDPNAYMLDVPLVVPEPTSLSLMILGGGFLLRRRKTAPTA